MAGVNKVILIGNLGKDPEIRQLENGTKVASFSLATTETYKNRDGNKVEQTEWHNIVLWRGLAEIAEKFLKKGNTIYLEGKIRSRSWDDKEGNKRYTTEIIGDNMTMIGGRRELDGSAPQGAGDKAPEQPDIVPGGEGDDLPF
ncbi:MAG TPA: single-stranded DNA-binding protein [Bacteroidales bacterium]|nr:single-stranded DNA-binding protein [Bacteroidales bacterium]HQI70302.1 single-stranded DNA-binding protein [Bacteroidales bacterium]